MNKSTEAEHKLKAMHERCMPYMSSVGDEFEPAIPCHCLNQKHDLVFDVVAFGCGRRSNLIVS